MHCFLQIVSLECCKLPLMFQVFLFNLAPLVAIVFQVTQLFTLYHCLVSRLTILPRNY